MFSPRSFGIPAPWWCLSIDRRQLNTVYKLGSIRRQASNILFYAWSEKEDKCSYSSGGPYTKLSRLSILAANLVTNSSTCFLQNEKLSQIQRAYCCFKFESYPQPSSRMSGPARGSKGPCGRVCDQGKQSMTKSMRRILLVLGF